MKFLNTHGGNIYALSQKYNINPDKIIDFSVNLNPLGISSKIHRILKEGLKNIDKYPDPDYCQLIESIAEYNNLSNKNIIVGNGATEIIFHFMRVFNHRKVLIVEPTFSEYERALKICNSDIEYFELLETDDFVIDIEQLKVRLKKGYDLLIICNPNNPTGKLIDLSKIEEILSESKKYGTFVMLDESFIEFTEGFFSNSAANLNNNLDNFFVVRALTKFYSIPGLRLGYGITYNKEILQKYNETKEIWSINTFASNAGNILLKDIKYIEKSKALIKKEKDFLFSELSKLTNIKVYKSDANFFLIKLLDGTKSAEFLLKMLKYKILVRDASNFTFLEESFIRVAVKDRKSNIALLKAFKNF